MDIGRRIVAVVIGVTHKTREFHVCGGFQREWIPSEIALPRIVQIPRRIVENPGAVGRVAAGRHILIELRHVVEESVCGPNSHPAIAMDIPRESEPRGQEQHAVVVVGRTNSGIAGIKRSGRSVVEHLAFGARKERLLVNVHIPAERAVGRYEGIPSQAGVHRQPAGRLPRVLYVRTKRILVGLMR